LEESGKDALRAKKSGKPNIAPLNHLPLLPSGPGGVQQELAVPICRCKGTKESIPCKPSSAKKLLSSLIIYSVLAVNAFYFKIVKEIAI